MSQTILREAFEDELLDWLNRNHCREGSFIRRDTALFRERWLDSLAVLELIAWTERAIGRTIPDEQIRMDHFRSVADIALHFVRGDDDAR